MHLNKRHICGSSDADNSLWWSVCSIIMKHTQDITTHNAPTGTHALSITHSWHHHHQRRKCLLFLGGLDQRRAARSLPNISMTSLPRSPITKAVTVLSPNRPKRRQQQWRRPRWPSAGLNVLQFYLHRMCQTWAAVKSICSRVDLKGNPSSISRVTLSAGRQPSPATVTVTWNSNRWRWSSAASSGYWTDQKVVAWVPKSVWDANIITGSANVVVCRWFAAFNL